MAKQGFKNRNANTFIYQEQTKSTAMGFDKDETNLFKIITSNTTGVAPESGGMEPTAGFASIIMDAGGSIGDIIVVPESSGHIVMKRVYQITDGAANSGVVIVDETGQIGSTMDTVDGTVLIGRTSGQPTFSATPSVTSITINNAPVNPTDGANKAYVDALAAGFTFIDEVLLGTTGALTATYANGAAGVGATLTNSGTQVALSIDGVATAPGDRILVKNQVTEFQNGIYEVTTIGSGATNWVITRTTDYDMAPSQIKPGNIVPVTSGTVNGGTSWLQTRVVTTIGTDPIVFIQFTHSDSGFLLKAANLSDVASVSTSRTNLGLTNVATSTTVNHTVQVGNNANGLTSITVGSIGDVLIGAGGSSDPAFAPLGTNSGLTNHGLVVGQGNSPLVSTAVGTNGQVLKGVTASDPQWGQLTLTTDVTGILPVANGGTGDATFTPYAVITGGTTGTGALQNVSGLGTSGQVLTSNGAGALPTWQAGGGGGGGSINITTYQVGSYTFTPQSNTKIVEVFGWSGGGGGRASDEDSAGGSGFCIYLRTLRSLLPSSIPIEVGAGGVGVTGIGTLGGNGGTTAFGNYNAGYPTALGNNGAGQNQARGQSIADGVVYNFTALTAYDTSGVGRASFSGSYDSWGGSMKGTRGGLSGPITTVPFDGSGSRGGAITYNTIVAGGIQPSRTDSTPVILAGGIAGTVGSPNGGNGNDGIIMMGSTPTSTSGYLIGGTGGGGGYYISGNGGNGGFPGGGGGGAGQTSGPFGTGGNGGDGLMIIIEYA